MRVALAASLLSFAFAGHAYAQASSTSAAPAAAAAEPQRASPSNEESQTLFDSGTKLGWYGGVHVKATPILDTASVLVGGQGGMLVGHSLIIGGGGYGLASWIDLPSSMRTSGASSRLSMGYGGARVGWILFPRSIAHAVVGALVGGGSVTWEANTGAFEMDDGVREPDMATRNDGFFVLEPDLELEINLHRLVRFAVTGSYRWVRAIDAPALSNSDLQGPALGAVVEVGAF